MAIHQYIAIMTRSDSRRTGIMALAAVAKTGVEFDVANRVFFRLYQASNLMHKQGTRYVGPFGATTQQWAVLGALARPLVRDDGMMVKDLMEFLDVSRPNLTAVLARAIAPHRGQRAQSPSAAVRGLESS